MNDPREKAEDREPNTSAFSEPNADADREPNTLGLADPTADDREPNTLNEPSTDPS